MLHINYTDAQQILSLSRDQHFFGLVLLKWQYANECVIFIYGNQRNYTFHTFDVSFIWWDQPDQQLYKIYLMHCNARSCTELLCLVPWGTIDPILDLRMLQNTYLDVYCIILVVKCVLQLNIDNHKLTLNQCKRFRFNFNIFKWFFFA